MKKGNHALLFSFLTAAVLSPTYVHALPTVYVNSTYPSHRQEHYTLGVDVFKTITEAVEAVDEGGTVYITSGIYNEPLTITKSVSLVGNGTLPASGANANAPIIHGDTATATITILGKGKPVAVTIKNLIITRGTYGIAVLTNAQVKIVHNTVHNYKKNGITFGPVYLPEQGGVSGNIENNVVTGRGPVDDLAQNGIQISEHSLAKIKGNTIREHMFTQPGKRWATGILVHQSDGIVISNNTLQNNQLGINIIRSNNTSIERNTVTGNKVSQAGIMVSNTTTEKEYTTRKNQVRRNTITGGSVGIWSSYAHDNTYLANSISKTIPFRHLSLR